MSRSFVVAVLVAGALLAAGSAVAQQQQQQQRQQQDRASAMNQMLADRVFVNLAESPSLGTASIRVTAEQGTVTLAGAVPDQQAERRALRLARRTPGVQEVVDQLEVQPGLSGAAAEQQCQAQDISDGVLARQVAQKLATQTFPNASAEEDLVWGWDVEGPDEAWEFDVEVDDRIVTLEGEVPRYDAIRDAVAAAREVACVQAVRNELWAEPYYGYGAYPGYAYGPYAGYGYYDPYVGY